MCKDARVDLKDGLCLTEVFPVVKVIARCDGKPPADLITVKLDSLMLVLVFRRRPGFHGSFAAAAKGYINTADEMLTEGLTLDLSIPEELESTTQVINLQGAPVICPAAEGLHELSLTFVVKHEDSVVTEVATPLHILVSHSLS